MCKILNIETATDVCSVSISEGNEIVAVKETSEGRSHAISLAVFIRDIFDQTGLTPQDLDAVAVSMGPGSFTGLRIGVSTAKGICYGADIPLIAINSLEIMCSGLIDSLEAKGEMLTENTLFAPMIDARRMEVYTAFFDKNRNYVKESHALIVDADTFDIMAKDQKLYLFGSGADKFTETLTTPNLQIQTGFKLSSSFMAKIADLKYKSKSFEDMAYFEPYYLKDFITTTSKKKLF